MTSLVVDASAVVDYLVAGTRSDEVRTRMAGSDRLVAPDHVGVEVLSALARLERAGRVDPAVAHQAITNWAQATVERLPVQPLEPLAWSLRKQLRLSDAHYVALARLLDAPLLTCDGRLARSALAHVPVSLVQ